MTSASPTLLRRTAAVLYRAGRSLERAEDMARIVLVHGDTHVDLPVGEDIGWSPLLDIAGLRQDFVDAYPAFLPMREQRAVTVVAPEAEVVEFLLRAPVNHDSVLANLEVVREAMRSARTVIPREAWERTNAACLSLRDQTAALSRRDGRVRWLREVLAHCERINGALWGSMRRDGAMALIRLGQHLERAERTCRFLSVRAESAVADAGEGDPYDHIRAMSLLRSLAAYQQYRRAMPARPRAGSMVGFILGDEAFPRTVAACLSEVRSQLKDLPRSQEALTACAEASLVVTGAVTEGLDAGDLRRLLAEIEAQLQAVDARIVEAVFSDPAESMPHRHRAPTDHLPGDRYMLGCSRVVHRTTYHYDEAAEESHNETHLRPRTTLRQRVLSSRIDVTPAPDSLTESIDAFGNAMTSFVVRGWFQELTVAATSEVELWSAPPPPASPPWESVRETLDRDRRLDSRFARSFRSPSRLVPATDALAAYAALSFEPRRPMVEAVRDLCRRINRDFSYESGFTSVTTPVLEVFEARRGVCQDFTHVAIGCLRSIGLAGRYVSGYIQTFRTAGDEMTGADASHAWASTYLPGWGWLDFDPTNDIVVCERHITTAWGRDFLDVSPLRGSVVGGGSKHALEVSVDVQVVEPGEPLGAAPVHAGQPPA